MELYKIAFWKVAWYCKLYLVCFRRLAMVLPMARGQVVPMLIIMIFIIVL